jgi:aminopeptidase
MRASREFSDMVGKNATPWCVFSAPADGWNEQVFPGKSPQEAEEAMWEAIFAMCRMDQSDPVAAWKAHIDDLAKRAQYLTAKAYVTYKYRGPGTDLSIGMPQNHLWAGAAATSQNGIYFVPNMPTEEVFTMPHRERVEGYVSSTKPLNAGGETIREFTLTFEAGRVVKATARQGETRLNQLLDTDENSRRLGEIALVPHSSPISQTGLVFNNGLIDENAACHLALGSAYHESLEGALQMSDEQFTAAGGNISDLHEDFMIGSGELDIDGITAAGDAEPVMRSGEWAFSV